MSALLRFEWRRLRSLRGNWAMAAAVVAFALAADLTAAGRPLDAEGAVFHLVQRDLAVRWLMAAAIGAQAFGHDFRHGTIRPSLLAFPRRGRLLAAGPSPRRWPAPRSRCSPRRPPPRCCWP